MKKLISFILCVCFVCSFSCTPTYAGENDSFQSQLSEMIRKYEEDDYFSVMSVKIGESEINIDGETVPIDDEGTVPYVENGRTMMPVRGIAEAMGAEVSFDENGQVVTVESLETTVCMTIGLDEMEVNGEAVALLNAPKIVNDRTMLPVRDVAEALDCDVEWVDETETAVFTRPLQTKRIIAFSERAENDEAVMMASGESVTVMQFDSVENTKNALEELESKGIKAEPDYVRKVSAMSWGIDDIGSKSYYNETSYAAGSAVVAVVDTGVDLSHEYFKGKLVSGYDIYGNDSVPQDSNGHGTHVSSTVLDVAGFNSNIKVMPVKVFGSSDSTYSTTIAQGIEYAVNHGADVINLSVGGQHYSDYEQQAINYAYNKNVAVVAAAGNEQLNLKYTNYSPGGLNHVITVSALNENGALAYFSNYGDGIVEFAAPGVNIKGAKLGGGYCTMNGTSMASPHVAGAYAIVKAVHKNESVDEITAALGKNARDKGNSAYYGYGYIKVNALEKRLSSVSSSNVKISDVSENSASFSGTVSYKGIIPQYIGARLSTTRNGNYSDVNSVRFVDNGNGEMNYSSTLSSLQSGTTYYVNLFMKTGGLDYISESIEFTTNGTPNNPEPQPEPDKSELRIEPSGYPRGEIKLGSSFNLSGRIKSNCHITDVRAYLLDGNKNVLQEASGWTTTQTYVIENSALDKGMKFNQLSAGTYYLKYTASDESGNSVSWTSDAFRVVANEKVPDGDTVTATVLIPDSFDSLSIRTGASTKYEIIGSMNHTDKCKVFTDKTQNGWYYVEYNGIYGYAAGNYIYLPSETKTGTVNIPASWDDLSIRIGPSTKHQIVGSMNNSEKCTVFTDKTKNGWYFVEYNGVYGYASGNCINY